MTTQTITQLDERTREELQPPCEAGHTVCYCEWCKGQATGAHHCDNPAAWIVRAVGNPLIVLCCDRHMSEIRENNGDKVRIEPLR